MLKGIQVSSIALLIFCFFLAIPQPIVISQNLNAKEGLAKQSKSLELWVGEYSFSEYAAPNQNVNYSVKIYFERGKCYANIRNDGFQTMERLLAVVIGDEKIIKLKFLRYLPDNMFKPYKEGDILISFGKKDSQLITYWGKIQPILLKNTKAGHYFQNRKG